MPRNKQGLSLIIRYYFFFVLPGIKPLKNGSEDAIYPYVHKLTKEFTNLPFRQES
jgi:hypothetical protein